MRRHALSTLHTTIHAGLNTGLIGKLSSIHRRTALTLAITLPFAALGTAISAPRFDLAPAAEVWLSAAEALILSGLVTLVIHWLVLRPLFRELAAINRQQVALQTGCHQCAEELTATVDETAIVNHAKSQFIATVSHELRTPLNAIIGFSQIIRDDTPRQSPQAIHADFAQEIYASGVHLLTLINEMLELANVEAEAGRLAPETLDVRQLLAGCSRLIAHQATDAGLSVTTVVAQGAETVFATPKLLRQILHHLLSNAIKFTPPGGAITVKAETAGDQLILSVTDTGIGITTDDLDKVFQPFWQAAPVMSRRYNGVGLGLSLVQSLTEHLGGYVEIDSAPGRGTRVSVVLPLHAGANMTSLRGADRIS